MRAVVLQSNYLPWRGYFDLIHDADVFVYYDEVKYTKNDWRNRNRIYAKNGLSWLTVPIAAGAVRQSISEVEIPDDRWQAKHWRALVTAYSSAPHFDAIEDLLRDAYLERRWRRLVDVDRHFIAAIAGRLGCTTRFVDSKDLPLREGRIERLLGVLAEVGATEYLSGPSGRDYLAGHEGRFAERGIELTYKDYAGYPPYPQRREPFEPAVSILDLVAHVGWGRAPWYVWGWREASTQPAASRDSISSSDR